ncbi:MAG TPA: hypothetical protein VIR03_01035, partial [Candidatus Saccharimonadales bacterium]
DKPFECVGTLDECQLALGMIHANTDFFNGLPEDFKELVTQHLPNDYGHLYKELLLSFDRENNIPIELRDAAYQFFAQHLY